MKKASIEYVLRKLGISYFKDNGEWLMSSCPLAPWTHSGGTDSRPSFGVHEGSGVSGTHCFSCGFSGGMLALVRKYGQHAVEDGTITEQGIKELEDYILLAEEKDEVHTPVIVDEARVGVEIHRHLKKQHPYFEKRGITQESVNKWQLGFVDYFYDAETEQSLSKRALFPVFANNSSMYELKGVVCRSFAGEEPKYINMPKKFKKSNYVYGGWLADNKPNIIVVEGTVDCIVLNQNIEEAGLADFHAVALMGADPSSRQIEWLKDNADEVIIMLDNDTAGQAGAKKLQDALDRYLIVTTVSWQDAHKDPADAGKYAISMLEGRITPLERAVNHLLDI